LYPSCFGAHLGAREALGVLITNVLTATAEALKGHALKTAALTANAIKTNDLKTNDLRSNDLKTVANAHESIGSAFKLVRESKKTQLLIRKAEAKEKIAARVHRLQSSNSLTMVVIHSGPPCPALKTKTISSTRRSR
jgi:hypothetical protein